MSGSYALPVRRRAALTALGLAALGPVLGCNKSTGSLKDGSRLVTLGGPITEIVFALGAGPHVVGADASSTYPEPVSGLPKVGYHRNFSIEGVLGLRPTLVVLSDESGPPAALEQLRQVGIRTVRLNAVTKLSAARERLMKIGEALGLRERATELVQKVDQELEVAQASVPASAKRPRVLFIYARGAGALSVAGRDTSADEMLRLAGADNAMSTIDGFRTLTSEGVVAAAPDVVLVTTRGKEGLGGEAAVLQVPGVALTPAGHARRVIAMDDLMLLGFGPRLGQAAAQLAKSINASLG